MAIAENSTFKKSVQTKATIMTNIQTRVFTPDEGFECSSFGTNVLGSD